ncbi:acyl-CoA N-acyltransferase [Schizophyllum commune H4-8]|uniref:acyl-CoA N-acyltransferase n=1 Tax=Schizophyllum commune (strain H4-8 / FGSC 9210) TaxID=578458 RepID=UPI00215E59F0|nr:acyl-CoA N-acyltransferase [Schizophyllum commune H4-8]KAI5885621.1 acyl-CoA N-acyltransferase [Schizophyllum commune H4-8]
MADLDLLFAPVPASDLETAIAIEKASYPEDEAATLEGFRYRQSQAPDLFLGAYLPARPDGTPSRTLIGYICATTSPASTLTHESMSNHVPGASSVCIHSVCVAPEYRRRGIALRLLKEYVARLESQMSTPYTRILLIAHDDLVPLYEKAGFTLVGPSKVQHGARPWFEMKRELREGVLSREAAKELPPAQAVPPAPQAPPAQSDPQQPQSLPPGLFEALQRSSTRTRPSGKLLSELPGGMADVVEASADKPGAMVNKHDLLCPREGCGSIILKAGAATWTERASVHMEPAGSAPNPHLAALPPPPETTQWWLVTGSMMTFENIGFSNTIPSAEKGGASMKLLTCAECDLGPLGWNEVGGKEFWLAAARVAYRG